MGWLKEIGFQSTDDLAPYGAVAVYLRVKKRHPQASLNLLYALEGALRGVKWTELSAETKQSLLSSLRQIDA